MISAEEGLYLTKARMRQALSQSAIDALSASIDGDSALASHHAIWTLFSDRPDRQRDFLWREERAGHFYLLSNRVPEDRYGIFELDESKSFAPRLRSGDRLQFALRVNATVARRVSVGARSKAHDIICDALLREGSTGESKPGDRRRLVYPIAREWLAARGPRHGFSIAPSPAVDPEEWEPEWRDPFRVLGYRSVRIDRGKAPVMRIGVLDLEGEIIVEQPDAFVAAVAKGFGRAKAFGLGLMMLRRSR